MPLLKPPISLKMACLRSIVNQMDNFWCVTYREAFAKNNSWKFSFIEGPFNFLDSESVEEIVKQMASRSKMTKLHLDIFIIPSLKVIDFSYSPKLVTDDILDLVCIRCRGVKQLILNHCDKVSSKALVKIVRTFRQTLTHIFFAGVKMSVELLRLIGNCCRNLKVLSIDMCKVTKLGIKQLFFIGNDWTITPTGKSLQAIHMLGCSFEDDIYILSKILKHCPKLQCITHFGIWDCLAEICDNHPQQLNVRGVRHDMSLDLSSFQDCLHKIPQMAKCLPYLNHLCINNVKGMDIPLFQLISGCGSKLKSLNTDWVYPYSFIHYVGTLCPGLDTLTINILEIPYPGQSCFCKAQNAFEQYLESNKLFVKNSMSWLKLEHLSISWPHSPRGSPLVRSTNVLLKIFEAAAKSLISISFMHLPDPDVDSLIIHALDSKCFQNLKSLSICKVEHASLKLIWDLLLTAPKISKVSIASCSMLPTSYSSRILQFTQENNFDVELEWI